MIQITEEVRYRLRLADGFLDEARQDMASQRWRACVDHSQLATENAAKAMLALLGPVGRTHNPAMPLRQALKDGRFPSDIVQQVARVAECAELLGPDIHIESDYGDEAGGRTPWELFDETDARRALSLAEDAVLIAQRVTQSN
ncbi:MAG: HEPN domain-containing protein [Candidatus Latescibacteria bacterium]|nr:HEPN domain-containing protein [Candidatus Latescibacterota bacterium]